MRPADRRQAGFTLVEILIAVVVMSVGLLGVAALQLVSLRDCNRSAERSQATLLAYDIADRMRANMAATHAGDYLVEADNPPPAPNVSDGAFAQDHCRTDFTATAKPGACNSGEMAAADLYDWFATVRNTLPGGVGEIRCTDIDTTDGDSCSAGSTFRVTIMWDEQRAGANGVGCDADNSTDRFCLSITTEI